MSERATIAIEKRVKVNSGASRQLRKTGLVPASVSSKGKDSISVKVKKDDLIKGLSKYGRNYLFNLDLEGKENIIAMVKALNYSPVKRDLLSVDFQEISLTEEIKISVGVRLIGREAVEFRKLMVMMQMDQISLKGLPQNMPDSIEIDVTNFDADDKVTIGDIKYPEGISPDEEADKIVLIVSRPRVHEEEVEGEDVTDESDEETDSDEA